MGSGAAPGHQKCQGIPEETPFRCCSSPFPEFKKISEKGCVQPVCFLAVEQIGLFYSLFCQQHPREQEEAE